MDIFSSTSIPLVEQVVNFSQARHGVLAGNIANLDTPGYHVRDLSQQMFQTKLKEALNDRDRTGGSFSPGNPREMGHDPLQGLGKSNEFLHHDDTNASLEGQVSEIAKNEMQHNVALSILISQFRMLQTAISERA